MNWAAVHDRVCSPRMLAGYAISPQACGTYHINHPPNDARPPYHWYVRAFDLAEYGEGVGSFGGYWLGRPHM